MWSDLTRRGVVATVPAQVRDAEERYAVRYRPPRANPERVVITITIAVDRVMESI